MPVRRRPCQWCLGQQVFPNLDSLLAHIKALHMESLDPPRYKPLPVAVSKPEDPEDPEEIPQGQEGDW